MTAGTPADPTDAQLDRELGLTSWEHSCRHLLDPERCCRRQAGHGGQCVTGYGAGRVRFDSEVTT